MNQWLVYGINAVILVTVYLLYHRKKLDKTVMGAAAELIPEAEELFADQEKSGECKKEWVIDQIMELLSILQRSLINRETVGDAVQFVFDRLSKWMKVK